MKNRRGFYYYRKGQAWGIVPVCVDRRQELDIYVDVHVPINGDTHYETKAFILPDGGYEAVVLYA